MARRLRGFSQGRTSGKRRQTGWEAGPGSLTMAEGTLSGSGNLIIGSGIAPVVDGLTLVRTRGDITMGLRTAGSVGDGFLVGVGIGIVTNDAFAVGVTAVPSPIDDMDWDGWLFHKLVNLFTVVGTEDNPVTAARIDVDSKAMRKIGINETMYLSAQGVEVGVATMAIAGITRTLFKLA